MIISISIYRGEESIALVPIIHCRESRWYIELSKNVELYEIGNAIFEAKEYLSNESAKPVPEDDHIRIPTWKLISKFKSRISFVKNTQHCFVDFKSENIVITSELVSEEFKGQYGDVCKKIYLPLSATAQEIGEAVIDVLNAVDEYYSRNKFDPNKKIVEKVELLNGSMLNVTKPSDKHFIDGFDHGAAEIYVSYDYVARDGDDASAVFYIGLGAELDCCLTEKNILDRWQETYGTADSLLINETDKGVYSLRAEFRNKEVHKISYYLRQSDDLLLECGMEVYKPGRRKKLDEKLQEQFEELTLSCNLD
ncbi:MAG: hypothetical protein K6F92_00835 [Lachnospiraceae bacterium]|nr:hypothetical protein [Lachnospiraceae bacterium]